MSYGLLYELVTNLVISNHDLDPECESSGYASGTFVNGAIRKILSLVQAEQSQNVGLARQDVDMELKPEVRTPEEAL